MPNIHELMANKTCQI